MPSDDNRVGAKCLWHVFERPVLCKHYTAQVVRRGGALVKSMTQPEGRGFDSCSSRHVGTLGKSFTYSFLCASAWNSDTVSVLQSGAPLS